MFERLESEGRIGKLCIPNRVVMTAMGTSLAALGGGVSDDIIAFYEERAQGGVGLIISEITRIEDGSGCGMLCQLAARSLSDVPGLERLCKTIHKYDTKIFIQLQHPGRNASSLLTGVQPVAPSAIASENGELPRELTKQECRELIQKFVNGAVLVQLAGADGVELHAAHGYLINEFLSAAMNERKDEYGGSFENRMRFLVEIIEGIRQKCGSDFPIAVRINAEETGGMDLEEAKKVAAALEKTGIDAIDVSCYTEACIEPASYPQGYKKPLTQAIKSVVTIPVIGTSNIKEPEIAEELLQENVCDFVGAARANLADAQWCRKAFSGKSCEIQKCVGCLMCFREIIQCHRIKCAVGEGKKRMQNRLIVPREEIEHFMKDGQMNHQYGIQVFCEMDREAAQSLLPPPLKVAEACPGTGALVYIYIVNIREPSFGPWYMEGGIGIVAQHEGVSGVHFLGLQLSGPGALMGMCSGRETSGLPKKICERIHVERMGNMGHCFIERNGVRLIDVELEMGQYNEPVMKLMSGAQEGCTKENPITTEGGCILFRYQLKKTQFTELKMCHYDSPTKYYAWEPATAKVTLGSSADDPWGEIKLTKVFGAGWMVSDNWARSNDTIHQYTDEETKDVMPYLFSGRYDRCTLYQDHQIYE